MVHTEPGAHRHALGNAGRSCVAGTEEEGQRDGLREMDFGRSGTGRPTSWGNRTSHKFVSHWLIFKFWKDQAGAEEDGGVGSGG